MHNVGLLEAEVNLVKKKKKPKVLMLSHYSMSEEPRPFWIFARGEKNDKELHLRKKAIGSEMP